LSMKIGILAVQGDFREHKNMLSGLGVETVEVRLPGGESTTIGKLAVEFGLMDPLRAFGKSHAIWGTCAGAIFLSKDIHRNQPLLGLMDITVERNAFGRQVDSFEVDLDVPCLKELDPKEAPFHAVFIRAPLIEAVHGDAQILARLSDDRIVAVRQGKLLATSFHPELTGDNRFHQYFVELAK